MGRKSKMYIIFLAALITITIAAFGISKSSLLKGAAKPSSEVAVNSESDKLANGDSKDSSNSSISSGNDLKDSNSVDSNNSANSYLSNSGIVIDGNSSVSSTAGKDSYIAYGYGKFPGNYSTNPLSAQSSGQAAKKPGSAANSQQQTQSTGVEGGDKDVNKKPNGPEVTKQSTIWIVGDSTVSSFNDNYYYPRYGWGTQIGNYLDGSFKVQNLALSGRSSKSYTADPEYKTLLSGMKSGDYLLIGFGHNDEKLEAERYTNPNGTYLDEGSFANSLYKNYIKQAEAAGCKVVLCTPIVRRTETAEWSGSNLHVTTGLGEFVGGDYSQAVRNLGKTLKIPVVDMTSLTKSLYNKLGPDETINLHAWTSSKPASVDNTHTNIWGAKYNAYFVTKTIKELGVSGLAEHVINSAVPTKKDSLVINPDYKSSTYTGILKQSDLWKDYGIWKGTVFGDVGLEPSTQNQMLEKDSDGNMHIAVSNNKGKIAANSDGIAMYYYKVPVSSKFTLTAKAKVNKLTVNDQVSFGLMARDEMYIDYNTMGALGDYVAAGPLRLTKTGNVWNCFARKSGALTQGGACANPIAVGDTVNLSIQSSSDGYACTFGNESTITGGFDFKLTSIDPNYVYVGMFVARNADITFSDIKLVVDGKEVTTK
jgi:lysophospholipase L1-like esterase